MRFNPRLIQVRMAFRLVLLVCLGLLAGCSTLRFGYNHADSLLLAGLDHYLDLDPAQKRMAGRRLESLLAWHRETQLRDYSALLREAREKIRGPVDAEVVLAFGAKLRERLAVLAQHMAPDIARLALTLNPRQLVTMQSEWEEDNEEFRIAYAGGNWDQLGEMLADRFMKGARFWFGSLSRDQKKLIRGSFALRDGLNRFRWEERERRQQELQAVLDAIRSDRPEPRQATERVRAFFAEFASQPDPERRAKAERLRRSTAALIAALINAATPEQRIELGEKLEGFADDFAALAGESEAVIDEASGG